MNNAELDTKLAVLTEFNEYITWTVRENEAIDVETRSQLSSLVDVLETYASELCRQIEAKPATQVYFRWLTLMSMHALCVKEYLFERFPVLALYRRCKEPANVQEETVKHLLDAIDVFCAAKAEMSGYLALPEYPGLSDQLTFATIGQQPTVKDQFAWEAEDETVIWNELMSAVAQ
jgi:hypothetical protein